MLLEMLRDGRLHLSGIGLLAPHLTEANRDEVLARATPPHQGADRGTRRGDRAEAGRATVDPQAASR
jgi:hypothetical protein